MSFRENSRILVACALLLLAALLRATEGAVYDHGRSLTQSSQELPQQKMIKTKTRCDEDRSGQALYGGCRPICDKTCADYHKGCRCKTLRGKCSRFFCMDDPKAKELHTRYCVCKCMGCRAPALPPPAAATAES